MDNKFPGKDISDEDIKSNFGSKERSQHKSKLKLKTEFGGKIPVFAGPNMVESEKLIFDTANEVKNLEQNFKRRGI